MRRFFNWDAKFLSTLPARGATIRLVDVDAQQIIFLSTLPARGATSSCAVAPALILFLSTLPARGATRKDRSAGTDTADFYPRSPRGERRAGPADRLHTASHFYPRSPRGERPSSFGLEPSVMRFLSTLPARGATPGVFTSSFLMIFLSTLPARGATLPGVVGHGGLKISIHAPREGSDKGLSTSAVWPSNFYPRSPRGERPAGGYRVHRPSGFLSTLPARGATV